MPVDRVSSIKSRLRQIEVLNWSRLLAGLRYDKDLIIKMLKGSGMLEESVIYRDIFQKGEQQVLQKGLEQGLEREARKVAVRLLERRFGKLSQRSNRSGDSQPSSWKPCVIRCSV